MTDDKSFWGPSEQDEFEARMERLLMYLDREVEDLEHSAAMIKNVLAAARARSTHDLYLYEMVECAKALRCDPERMLYHIMGAPKNYRELVPGGTLSPVLWERIRDLKRREEPTP